MGCKLCRTKETEQFLDIGRKEESNNGVEALPTLDFAENKDYRQNLFQYTFSKSASSSIKFGTLKSPRQESAGISPISYPLIVVTDLTLSNSKNKDEASKKDIKGTPNSKEAPVARSLSIAFDYSCLVKEKKGSLFEKYKVLEMLGKGTYGTVKKAIHKSTGKLYALKMISRNCYITEGNVINEIEVLKKLDHPNILRIYEFGQDKQYFYLITEYCEGGDMLNKLVTLSKITEQVAANIMKQILSAVSYCHAKSIVHRDLKLENIVLESSEIEGNIKVIDFGTSRIFKPRERLREIMGTAYYIAPEVLKEDYNEKCDIWSCGVILYIFLSGMPPFPGHNNEEIMKNVEIGTPSFAEPQWKHISLDAINFIKKMLTYNPKRRPTAEQALSDIWILKYGRRRVSVCDIQYTMKNLKEFKATSLMHKAVLSYIVTYVMSKKKEKKLREIFDILDTNKDGKLSHEELIEGFNIAYGEDMHTAREEAKNVMRKTDINKNGSIDYNEFLIANMQEEDYTNEQLLKVAFDFFDEDHNGQISVEEIRRLFAENKGDEPVHKILNEADMDNDGQISFAEFKDVMTRYASSGNR